jgi:hypothetical protein
MSGRFNDLTGKRFGKITVISKGDKVGSHFYWNCVCDCGKKIYYRIDQLKRGENANCGCLSKKHGLHYTRLYNIWGNMKQRCYNKNYTYFLYYGGRGIKICDEWLKDFMAFYDWAYANGYEDTLTIDRIDVNGNYEPSNCRWIPKEEQTKNVRRNRRLTYQGETHTFAEWSRILGIPPNTIWERANRNLSVEEILSTKKLKRRTNICKNSQ